MDKILNASIKLGKLGAPQVGSGPVNYANAASIVFLIHVKKLLLAVTLQFGFSAPPTLSLQFTSS